MSADIGAAALTAFQFHKGAIRTCLLILALLLLLHFNSIKVRLERILYLQGHGTTIFQFHKGAIRTQSCPSPAWYIRISIP